MEKCHICEKEFPESKLLKIEVGGCCSKEEVGICEACYEKQLNALSNGSKNCACSRNCKCH